MKRAGLVVLAGTLAAATVALAGPDSARVRDTSFRSQALGGKLGFEVYLPVGYDSGGIRYPVVYFLHGLPANGRAYESIGFVAKALDDSGKPAILVVPQGARDNDTDPEYVDHDDGRNWGSAIARELPRVVDARFRTIRSRQGRALIGVSAGGYGAMHLVLKHLSEFSVVESWSGYFHPTDSTGTKALPLGPDTDVHRQLQAQRSTLKRLPTFIAFYVGAGDWRFVAENRQLDAELTGAGVPHVFRVYDGGHEQSLWQRHAPAWLGLALSHLTSAG
jgi:enterochelin esterase-like enzyme